MKTKNLSFFLIPIFLLSVSACTTNPGPDDTELTVTPLPDTAVDKLGDIRSRISIASPDSLVSALEVLGSGQEGDSEAGAEMASIAWFILETVYPFSLPEVQDSEISPGQLYTGIFEDIKNGVFPELSQEDITFLTSLISPISILFTDSSVVREQSREVLNQLRTLNGASVLPIYLLGVLSEQEGDPLSALEYYTMAVEKDPSVYPAETGIAIIQMNGGQPEKAVVNLERLNGKFPGRPEILKLLGEVYYLLEDYSRAMDIAADALLLIPDDEEILFLRARILYQAGRFDQSRRILSIVEKEMPARWDVLHLKALLEVERGNGDEAVGILKRALELYPENDVLRNTCGDVLISLGRYEEGRALLSLKLESDQYDATSEKSLEILLDDAVSSGLWSDAEEYVQRLLVFRRDRELLLLARRIEVELGNTAAAMEIESELYESYPDDSEITDYYIRSLIVRGENEEAEELLKSGVDEETDFKRRSSLFFLLSIIADSESEKIDYLRSALLEDLENSEALIELSGIYYERRDYRNAYRYIKQAYLLEPGNTELKAEVERLEDLLP